MTTATATPPSSLTLRRPDDWHVHLRDGVAMAAVVGATARVFGRAIVMPNLRPPVMTTAMAQAYRERILAALPAGARFEPLMTLYLTDNTTPDEIAAAKASGIVHAAKYYPAGATTHSDSGVTAIERAHAALAAMEEHDVVLSLHGEVTDPDVDVFDRERVFVERHLARIVRDFPGLKRGLEHVTTARGGGFRRRCRPQRRRDDHAAASPVVAQRTLRRRPAAAFLLHARPEARIAPPRARASRDVGQPQVLPRHRLRAACPPGRRRAHAAAPAATRRPSRCRSMPKRSKRPARSTGLQAFASEFGADFYGLPRNADTVTLVRESWTVPAEYAFGDDCAGASARRRGRCAGSVAPGTLTPRCYPRR